MSLLNWIVEQQQHFDFDVEELLLEPNQFVHETWLISDPHGNGISFRISADDSGNASLLFPTALFRFERLNIAEGHSPIFLMEAAGVLLSGAIEVQRSRVLHLPTMLVHDRETGIMTKGTVSLADFILHRGRLESEIAKAFRGFRRR